MQLDGVRNVNTGTGFLDNEFRDPDLDRFTERFYELEPDVAVVGDARTPSEAHAIQERISELHEQYPDSHFIGVPKCAAALDIFEPPTVLGYANGYSMTKPADFSDPTDWRGRDIHILGGSPPSQWAVIQELTQPTLADHEPANIIGVDGNGLLKAAYFGEYWSQRGYRRADHLSIRETVQHSLQEIKTYWQEKGVWPETTPVERYGPATSEPYDPVYAVNGGDLQGLEQLEAAIVEDYADGITRAYRSDTEKRFVEYRDGLTAL